ncbi:MULTISPECIES: DUF4180 domain-containing protein [unclassified Crossiella]|uniref:DUF4180 domain-containing protein n=1 Tax=unclassified Crossiella TaxID=2620835 RepID=UPI001FFFEB1F|nr:MULTISPECIES: DUF4180 domain-containing protein [unclassified Crossiella]MCK2239157.1 DUF4180 domain-containing protein [Crossiella sp. S99.2]MCK2251274.1 DUF4180 domain-containing protein [Crossiella sp. S99.1]
MLEITHGVPVFHCAPQGPLLGTERDAADLIGEAWSQQARLIAIPVSRLAEGFFRLETRMAGEFTQKFVNYRVPLAFLGDISEHVQRSSALAGYVRETNRGNQIWYLADRAELDQRLGAEG